jgi:hemin uptake protein HemP
MSNDDPQAAPAPHSSSMQAPADDPCQMCRAIAGLRVMRSDELLQGQRELFILHAGQIYRLLRTRKDKLILQK